MECQPIHILSLLKPFIHIKKLKEKLIFFKLRKLISNHYLKNSTSSSNHKYGGNYKKREKSSSSETRTKKKASCLIGSLKNSSIDSPITVNYVNSLSMISPKPHLIKPPLSYIFLGIRYNLAIIPNLKE